MLSPGTRITTVFGILLLSCFALPQSAHAESFTINSGSVSVTSNVRDTLAFNFSGSGLTVTGFDLHAAPAQYQSPCLSSPSFCQPGDLVLPNAMIALSSEFGSGSAVTFNGTTVLVSWTAQDSFLQFTGPGVVIPNSASDVITVTTSFDMAGTIQVHPLNDPGSIVFSTLVNGSGIATLTLQRPAGNPQGFAITGARYDFQPASVPEPATLVLLGTSLTGVVVRRCRRGRRSKISQRK